MTVYDDMGHEIAKVAYELYERGGRIEGRNIENWLEAERIVMAHYSAKRQLEEAMSKAKPSPALAVEQAETAAPLKKTSKKIKSEKKTTAKKTTAKRTAKKTTTKKTETKTESKAKKTKK